MKKSLLWLVIGLGVVVNVSAQSAVQPTGQAMLEQRKAVALQREQARVKIHQDAQKCIQGAKTPEALKACKHQRREAQKQLHDRMVQEKVKQRASQK